MERHLADARLVRSLRESSLAALLRVTRPRAKPLSAAVECPQAIPPGEYFPIRVWLYAEEFEEEIRRLVQATRSLPGSGPFGTGPAGVLLNEFIQVSLWTAPPVSVVCQPPPVLWTGRWSSTMAQALVADDAEIGQTVPGKARLLVRGAEIGSVPFVVTIGRQGGVMDLQTGAVVKKAFVSYASADEPEVLRIMQGIQAAAPSVDLFYAPDSLSPGHHWWAEICQQIINSDKLYLCWSRNAARSEWVQREWQFALEQRGLDFIVPVPLEPPDIAPPPPQLKDLHFGSWHLAYIWGLHARGVA